jgi:hypothetical protein
MYGSLSDISGICSKKDKRCAESGFLARNSTQSETQQIGNTHPAHREKIFEWLACSFVRSFFFFITFGMELFIIGKFQNDSLVRYMTLYTAGTK